MNQWKVVVGLIKYEDRLEDNLLFMTEDEEKEFRVGNSPVLKLMNVDGDKKNTKDGKLLHRAAANYRQYGTILVRDGFNGDLMSQ